MDLLLNFCDYTTIAASLIIKVPQILTLLKTQSADGLSILGFFIELIGYLIVFCYNVVQGYALSTYFEYAFCILQDFALIILLFKVAGTLDVLKLGGLGLFAGMFYGFTLGIPHPRIMLLLIQFVTPISASSKLFQLREIWKTKNAESVSISTCLISVYTAATRALTNFMKSDGPLLTNSITALILNVGITLSAKYFQIQASKHSKFNSSSSAQQEDQDEVVDKSQ